MTALSVIGAFWHEAQGPALHPNFGPVDDPFSLTFSVSNPAAVLPIVSTGFECHVLVVHAHRISPATLKINLENGHYHDDAHFRVAPGKTVQIPCHPFDPSIHVEGGVAVDSAQIETRLLYSTLGIPRRAISQKFNWDSNSKQWTEGDVVP